MIHPRTRRFGRRVHFSAINRVALAHLPDLLNHWLPDGGQEGAEWNPKRDDRPSLVVPPAELRRLLGEEPSGDSGGRGRGV